MARDHLNQIMRPGDFVLYTSDSKIRFGVFVRAINSGIENPTEEQERNQGIIVRYRSFDYTRDATNMWQTRAIVKDRVMRFPARKYIKIERSMLQQNQIQEEINFLVEQSWNLQNVR